jgi:3-hydroxyisobutyrate dehydrogenase-like beta-hydroxyacid dehydrogenase
MDISFLGLGKMGSAMAGHLTERHNVIVWNRDQAKAEQFVSQFPRAEAKPTARYFLFLFFVSRL